jgi:hypothetical protein
LSPEGVVPGSIGHRIMPLPSDDGTTDGGMGGIISEAGLPGEPLPINLQGPVIPNDMPSDPKIRDVARELSNGRAGGASKMRTKDIK